MIAFRGQRKGGQLKRSIVRDVETPIGTQPVERCQLCNVIVGADEHDFRAIEHAPDEGARRRQLFGAIDRRIDLSAQALLNRPECR